MCSPTTLPVGGLFPNPGTTERTSTCPVTLPADLLISVLHLLAVTHPSHHPANIPGMLVTGKALLKTEEVWLAQALCSSLGTAEWSVHFSRLTLSRCWEESGMFSKSLGHFHTSTTQCTRYDICSVIGCAMRLNSTHCRLMGLGLLLKTQCARLMFGQ